MSVELFDLTGKTAIVTGSSRGIGHAIAHRMAQHGANVVVCGHSVESGKKASDAINKKLGANRTIGTSFDLADPNGAAPLIKTAVDRFGSVDILVCNAAVVTFGNFLKIDDKAMADSYAANVVHNARLATAAAEVMKSQGKGGAIMFITSSMAFFASQPMPAYTAAKAGLHWLMKSLALQFGPDGIRVNAIAPGIIATDASRFMVEDPKIADAITSQTPMRRFGDPDDIAGCAVFLAAPAGKYACGQVFLIDGGQLLEGTQAARQTMGTGM